MGLRETRKTRFQTGHESYQLPLLSEWLELMMNTVNFSWFSFEILSYKPKRYIVENSGKWITKELRIRCLFFFKSIFCSNLVSCIHVTFNLLECNNCNIIDRCILECLFYCISYFEKVKFIVNYLFKFFFFFSMEILLTVCCFCSLNTPLIFIFNFFPKPLFLIHANPSEFLLVFGSWMPIQE